jgi:hypothetical protein
LRISHSHAQVQAIGDRLRDILESPDQIQSLYRALAERLTRRKREDNSYSNRHTFFSEFRGSKGEHLCTTQVKDLVSLTRDWGLNIEDVERLSTCALIWSVTPEAFWIGDQPDKDLIQRCLNDLERINKVDPLKRKVILVTLSGEIEQERVRISNERNGRVTSRKRKRKRADKCGRREFLTTAIQSIAQQRYSNAGGDHAKHIRADSSYGWKWEQLRPIEIILGLPGAQR